MATDPYAAPKSHVQDASLAVPDAGFVPDGQKVAAGHAWQWIAEGFDLFKRQPGMWIGLFVLFVMVVGAASAVPFVGSLFTFLFGPVMTAGIVIGCRTLDRGGELEVAHLFAGFKEKMGPLVTVGAIYFAGWIAIMFVVFLLAGASAAALFFGADVKPDASTIGAGAAIGILLAVLVAMALSLPLVMAVWFAPPLVVFHDVAPMEAMKSSFRACLKNMVPFLLYGVFALVLMLLATLPLMLGWLVLGPVFAASFYTAYRDIFTTA